MCWCRENNHTHPQTLQDRPFAGAHCFCFHAAHQWVLWEGPRGNVSSGLTVSSALMASLSSAASPCELPFVGSCTGKQLEKAALCGEALPRSALKEGEWMKNRENYIDKWFICRRFWMSSVSHQSSTRSLWSRETWPCSGIIASISSSAGTPISPWVTEFKKQRKTGAICQLYCDAAQCRVFPRLMFLNISSLNGWLQNA